MKFDIYWSPEGRRIAKGIEARDSKMALRKAPLPYRKYKGEMYTLPSLWFEGFRVVKSPEAVCARFAAESGTEFEVDIHTGNLYWGKGRANAYLARAQAFISKLSLMELKLKIGSIVE